MNERARKLGRRRTLAVVTAVLTVALVGGCRGVDRAALPAPAPRSAPGATGSGVARPSGAAADPLAGIESSVDAIERDVDTDSRADSPGGR